MAKTLYQQIMDDILEKIERGYLQENDAVSTEAELEMQYSVSNITVRRALNELENMGIIHRIKGKGSFVSSLQSRKNNIKCKQGIITLIIPFDMQTGTAISIIQGLSEVINSSDYIMNIVNSEFDVDKEKKLIEQYQKESDAIVLYPISNLHNMDIIGILAAKKYPIVVIDKHIYNYPICNIECDNQQGAFEITKYLIQMGHKNIAFISDSPIEYASSISARFCGYVDALSKNDITLSEKNIYVDFLKISKGFNQNCYKDILINNRFTNTLKDFYGYVFSNLIKNNVTAVFVSHDSLAAEIIKVLPECGIKIPDDISIVGFDNLIISEHLSVPLTTVNQNLYEVGYKAGEVIIDSFKKHQPIVKSSIVIPTDIVKRQSVRKLC